MPTIPEIFNLAAADAAAAEEQDLNGLESASQRGTSIQGHAATVVHSAPVWRCAVCDSPNLQRLLDGNWSCADCGSLDYYRVSEQTWRRTGFGTWMFFPEGQEPPPPWLRATVTAETADSDQQPSGTPAAPSQARPARALQLDAGAGDDDKDLGILKAEIGQSRRSQKPSPMTQW